MAASDLSDGAELAVVSALTVTYRDFRFLIPLMAQTWMWLSFVAFPPLMVEHSRWRWLLALNPMAAGTVITATATTGLTVAVQGGTVPSTLNPSGASINYSFDDTTPSGTVTSSVRSPSGLISVFAQTLHKGLVNTSAPCP